MTTSRDVHVLRLSDGRTVYVRPSELRLTHTFDMATGKYTVRAEQDVELQIARNDAGAVR